MAADRFWPLFAPGAHFRGNTIPTPVPGGEAPPVSNDRRCPRGVVGTMPGEIMVGRRAPRRRLPAPWCQDTGVAPIAASGSRAPSTAASPSAPWGLLHCTHQRLHGAPPCIARQWSWVTSMTPPSAAEPGLDSFAPFPRSPPAHRTPPHTRSENPVRGRAACSLADQAPANMFSQIGVRGRFKQRHRQGPHRDERAPAPAGTGPIRPPPNIVRDAIRLTPI